MTKASFPTSILDINVFHCVGEDEHYCVDLNGYMALCDYFDENVINHVVAEKDILFYNKIPIRHNSNLDGDEDGSAGTNAANCEAKKAIP